MEDKYRAAFLKYIQMQIIYVRLNMYLYPPVKTSSSLPGLRNGAMYNSRLRDPQRRVLCFWYKISL